MHATSLSPEFRAELRARRQGREYLFDDLDPSRTALLVIDMQNVFVAPGAPLEVPVARGIVDNINVLATLLRDAGATIAWVRSTFSDAGRGSWPLYFSYFAPGDDGERLRREFFPGADGHAFWPGLGRRDDDLVVDKDRFSPFAAGASSLELQLRERRCDTVVITGTLTNVCCESAARDAMMQDFRCIVVEDANAARTDEEHVTSLENIARVFGDVMTTRELADRISGT